MFCARNDKSAARNPITRTVPTLGLALCAGLGWSVSAAQAQLVLKPVAISTATTGATPSGVSINAFNAPSVGDDGTIAFTGTLSGTGVTGADNLALFARPASGLAMAARTGEAIPGLPAGLAFAAIDTPIVSATGQLAFTATLAGASATTANNRVLISGMPGSLAVAARIGDAAPGAGAGVTYRDLQMPLLGPDGRMGFMAVLAGSGVLNSNMRAIYTGFPGQLSVAARTGGAVPNMPAGVTFAAVGMPVMNGGGQLGFLAFMQGPGISSANDAALFFGAGSALAPRFRHGSNTGVFAGTQFMAFNLPSINDAGDMAFMAFLQGTGALSAADSALFVDDGTLHGPARSAGVHPDMPLGQTWGLFGSPVIAGDGSVAFVATFNGVGVNTSNDAGLWTGRGGNLHLIARKGAPAATAGPGVVYARLDRPSINSRGQVVFTAGLAGTGVTTANDTVLLAFDPAMGLMQLARTGDHPRLSLYSPHVMTSIALLQGAGGQDGRATCINSTGLVAFAVNFGTGAGGGVMTAQLPASPADIAGVNGRFGADGLVTPEDLTAFMTAYAAGSLRADLVGVNGPARDGQVTEEDLAAFMAAYGQP